MNRALELADLLEANSRHGHLSAKIAQEVAGVLRAQQEALRLSRDAFESNWRVKGHDIFRSAKLTGNALSKINECLEFSEAAFVKELVAADKNAKDSPVDAIWYMRDNHTFKKLSKDVSTALIEIEEQLNLGYTHGMLCSKRPGFENIHSNGNKDRMRFLKDCRERLELIAIEDGEGNRLLDLIDQCIESAYYHSLSQAELKTHLVKELGTVLNNAAKWENYQAVNKGKEDIKNEKPASGLN